MSSKRSTDTNTSPDWDDIIGRVYDVALDPSRYEALLDHWESTMSPLREGTIDAQAIDEVTIIGHFERATEFLERADTGASGSEADQLIAQFDNVAAVVIGKTLSISAINEPAAGMLGAEAGANLSRMALEQSDCDALSRQCVTMMGDATAKPTVFRVRAEDEGRYLIFHMRRVTLKSEGPAVIAVTSNLVWPNGFGEILGAAFGLSIAEGEVVKRLVECCSIKEIAESRGRSIETVRGQVKTILAKTETRSQVELVRLILSMMDIASLTAAADPGPRSISKGFDRLEALPFHTVETDDGRSLDYLILGDPDGTPILYLHMDFGFCRWTATAEAEAKARGLKVVTPIRAGFGKSDMVPKGVEFGRRTAMDIATVLDAEGVGPCPVLALGADNMLAIELDLLRPGQVTALIVAGGVFPFVRPEQYERMDKWHRFIQAGARYTPQILPFLVKAGFHLAKKGGKRAFVHSVFGQSAADIQTFEDPEVFEAMITGSEICLSDSHSAHEAFSRQTLYEHGRERPDLIRQSEGRFPFFSYNGDMDPGVHALTAREFAEDYPWIEFTFYEDAGQLLFFRHWRVVLEKVTTFLR